MATMPSNLCANIENKDKLIELRYITRKSFTTLLEEMIDREHAVVTDARPTTGAGG